MKYKKFCLCIIILILAVSVYSEDSLKYPFENRIYHVLGQMVISFQEDTFIYHNHYQENNRLDIEPENFPPSDSGKYEIRIDHGYTIIRVYFSSGERDLIIFYHGQQIAVYDTKYEIVLWGQEKGYDGLGIYYFNSITATSFLTEIINGKKFEYKASNLSSWDITNAWVEGVDGDGIGEEIEAMVYNNHLVIVNGFFYPKDLSVYFKNNRVKEIVLTGYDEEDNFVFSQEYTLVDSPNLQVIVFPKRAARVNISIKSVYKGNKYRDTAISGIFKDGYLMEQLRSVESSNIK